MRRDAMGAGRKTLERGADARKEVRLASILTVKRFDVSV